MLPTRTPKLFLLGTPRIELSGQVIHLARHKSIALLAYLVLTGRTHLREWLATLLWPEVRSSRTQLRKSLADIRHQLGDACLTTTWDEVGVQEGTLWSDVGTLLSVSVNFHKQETASLLDVNYMLNLYPQHLLNGFTLRDAPNFDDWQRVEEQNLRTRYEHLVDFVVAQFIQQNQLPAALTLAHHWITINPYNEHARRQLIRLYAWTNQRAVALSEYQRFRADLWDNYRAEPEPQTRDLFHQLQSGTPSKTFDRQAAQPPMVAPLIGRDAELRLLVRMVKEGARLITITGPGGVGKTHLALATAHALRQSFDDGFYLVGLERGGNPRALIASLAQTLAVPLHIDLDPSTVVYDFLRTKRALIVLDSIHHINQAQLVIQALLHHAPHIVLILTSYHALDLNTEYCFALRGLATDSPNQANQSAVQLFVQGAKRVQPNFLLTSDNTADINRICQLVEGMPLGILLASAWCAVLAPCEIAEEIAENFDFLRVTHQDIPARHQSLRAVFESAWQWLTADEQHALMNLSIFPHSFTRKAAEQIALVQLETLKWLTSKALISFSPATQRFALHDVSRQYAGEKLANSGTHAHTRERHQQFYAHYLIERHHALRSSSKETAWREIESEFIHIRAAWRGILADHNFPLILQMMEPLHLFLRSRGWEQGLLLFDEARQVAAVYDQSRDVYHKLLMRFFPPNLGMERWQHELERALAVATTNGDLPEVAYLHGEFGWYGLSLGDDAQAQLHFAQAQAYYRAVDDRFALAAILRGIAYSDIALGQHGAAEQHAKASLRLRRTIGDQEGEHESLMLQAELALLRGDLATAGECFEVVYHYFRLRYSEVPVLFRCYSMGWYWVFSHQLEQAHAFAEKVVASLAREQAAVLVCSAHAIKLVAYGLQNQLAAVRHEIEQVEDGLMNHPLWDSTSNSDMRFLIDFSLVLGYTLLDQCDVALGFLRNLAKSGRLDHPVYFTWLAPILALWASKLGAAQLAQSLYRFHRASFLRHAEWARQWTERQNLAGGVNESAPHETIQQLAHAVLSLPNGVDVGHESPCD